VLGCRTPMTCALWDPAFASRSVASVTALLATPNFCADQMTSLYGMEFGKPLRGVVSLAREAHFLFFPEHLLV